MKSHEIPLNHPLHNKYSHLSSPPKQLFVAGEFRDGPLVSVIGSRKYTAYGKHVTELMVTELVHHGVGIVSGLALGIDSIAHRACLHAGGTTHAILPSGINNVYPASHRNLAQQIVESGGSLISEYTDTTRMFKSNFVARNRLVAGLGDILVVTESGQRSGTMHTVNFALEQGKDIFAVPGPINSPTSQGTNNLIQTGAQLLHDPMQLIEYLGLEKHTADTQLNLTFDNNAQQSVYALLGDGRILHAEVLQLQSRLNAAEFNQALTMLEIYGHIKNVGNNSWVRS